MRTSTEPLCNHCLNAQYIDGEYICQVGKKFDGAGCGAINPEAGWRVVMAEDRSAHYQSVACSGCKYYSKGKCADGTGIEPGRRACYWYEDK